MYYNCLHAQISHFRYVFKVIGQFSVAGDDALPREIIGYQNGIVQQFGIVFTE